MTTQVAELTVVVAAGTTPQAAVQARAVAEAKATLAVQEKLLEEWKNMAGAAGMIGKASDIATGKRLELGKVVGKVGSAKPIAGDEIDEVGASHFTSTEIDHLGVYNQATAAFGVAKNLISVYESGKSLGETLAKLDKDGVQGVSGAKALADIASAILTPVNEVGVMILKGLAGACSSRAWKIVKTGAAGSQTAAGRFTKMAKSLTGLADGLGTLEKVTGVLGVVSSALGVVEGWESGDAEAVLGGVADTVSGVATVAQVSWASAAGVGALQVKGMLLAARSMSASLQAIRNADLRRTVHGIAENLDLGAAAAERFEIAQHGWSARHGSNDPTERALADQFAERAATELDRMRTAVALALQSARNGSMKDFPMLQDDFFTSFGGRDVALALALDLQRPGRGPAEAERLQTALRQLSNGVGDLSLAMAALERDAAGGGTLRFSNDDRNRVTFDGVRVDLQPKSFACYPVPASGVSLQSPTHDSRYRTMLADWVAGQDLVSMKGVAVRLHVTVNGTAITLDVFEGAVRGTGWTEAAQAAVGHLEGAGTMETEAATKRLWRWVAPQLKVPAGLAGE